MIDQGSYLESTDLEGNTALLKCFTVLNDACPPGIIEIIIDRGADLDARNNAYRTALMLAAEKNQITAVEFLLAAGAFIDSRDRNGMTPLMYASYKGHIKIMQILIENNADIGSRLISDVVIGSKGDLPPFLPSNFPVFYKNKTVVPAGSTALTFAEKCGGRGAEKIILEAWVKKDPSIEEFLIEWRKKVTEL
ncbi:MAG: ankyrin repeat domain-containing protein [Chlamydiae bacterium]|nr:ankyrin repeat domain-containing protein [Chlamydiota bacterium]